MNLAVTKYLFNRLSNIKHCIKHEESFDIKWFPTCAFLLW